MKYCKNCLQPDTRPNTKFSKDQLCPACCYYEKVRDLNDWEERYNELLSVIKKYRNNRSNFDCIIGVSGGKDSTRQALWVRDKLGLKPLLVSLTYPPQQVTERGVNNLSNLINLGFDVVISSLSPITWKEMLKEGFKSFTNWAKGSELALLSCVPQIAIKYKINLILWGENPGLQLGDLKTVGKTEYDGNNLKFMNTLDGGSDKWLQQAGFSEKKLQPYKYPSQREFEKSSLQIIYLGWFWKDWSIINNGMYSVLTGLEIRKDQVENTGDLHGIFSLDEDWVTLNQMIKYYKYGFGRVSDYVNEEIRFGKMSRDEGIKLVELYDESCGQKYIDDFTNFIGISNEEFWTNIYRNVNKDLFTIENNGTIKRKFKVGIGL